METQKDFEGKPLVRICATCQNINASGMEQFGLGINEKIKEEMNEVNKQVIANSKKITFSHGLCNRHLYQTYQNIPGMTPERLASVKEKLKHNDSIPCLLENESLRHAYMKGLFTKEQIQQATQQIQQSNKTIKERFRKLSGIKND